MTKQKEQDWEEIREKLADIEHQRWADWQKYLHSKCISDEFGNLKIMSGNVKHWERQINTPYSELSEAEKKSDMNQVDRYWHLIKTLLSTTEDRVKREMLDSLPEEIPQDKIDDDFINQLTAWANQSMGRNQVIRDIKQKWWK
jgi:hypothetical protein